MTSPTFDSDGYPTEETLRAIREWPATDLRGLFEFMREAWYYPEYWRVEGNAHHVSTGGWSGNEDLIGALMDNKMAYTLAWVSSRRGGHYEFEVRELAAERKAKDGGR